MSEKKPDKEVFWMRETQPGPFEIRMNEILAQGGWRVEHTTISVYDSEYFALLIREDSAQQNNQKCEG